MHAKENGENSGPAIARAYTVANTAHDLLAEARSPLATRGCDLTPLL